MKISDSMSDSAIASELFDRIEKQRKALKITQDVLARNIGISRKSYSSAIRSGKTSVINFIAILRHLELLDNLELIANAPEQSPMAALKKIQFHNKRRTAINEALQIRQHIGKTLKAADAVVEALNQKENNLLVGEGEGGKAYLNVPSNPILAARQRLKVQE
jgi:hypothetical protein